MSEGSPLGRIRTFQTDIAAARKKVPASEKSETTTPPQTSAPEPAKKMSLQAEVDIAKATTQEKPEDKPVTPSATPTSPSPQQANHLSEEAVDSEATAESGDATFSDIEAGTIVQDKKSRRRGFFGALQENFTLWKAKRDRKKKVVEANTAKVSPAESRLETLQQAAKESARTPVDDHVRYLDAVSTNERTEEKDSGLQVKKKDTSAPSWGHYVEPNDNSPQKAVSQQATNMAAATTPKSSSVSPASETVAGTPVKAGSSLVPRQETEASKGSNVPVPQVVGTEKGAEKAQVSQVNEGPLLQPRSRGRLASLVSRVSPWLPKVGIALVALVAVGGGVYASFWFVSTNESTIVVENSAATERLIDVDTVETLRGPITKTGTYDALYNSLLRRSDTFTYRFVSESGDTLLTGELMTALEWRTNGAFRRSLQAVTLGGSASGEPFIVLKGTNFDSSFAGMLNWEQTLSADLAPLFGDTVRESFDPAARTDSQIRSAFFTDEIVANTSVRILRDTDNATRIIYGFVNPTTIIITTSETTYRSLLPLITSS